MDPWLVFLVTVTLPAMLTTLGLLQGRWSSQRPYPSLPSPAGPWIEDHIRRRGVPVAVEIVPAGSPDAYLPATATLALSEATYAGTSPRDYAVAAHELGHAGLAVLPVLRWLFPAARLVSALAWRLFVGATVIGLWVGEPAVADLALWALVTSVLAAALVCADEIGASTLARRWLSVDPQVSAWALARATDALLSAGGAYVLGWLGRVIVLAGWNPLREVLFAGVGGPIKGMGHLGTWLVLLLLPIVAIRAGLALAQVVRPERLPSQLDLWALVQRDSLWESLAASCVVATLVVLQASLQGPVLAMAAALATASALGQVQALVLAMVAIPAMLMARTFRRRPSMRYRWRARDDVPQAMVAMFSDPPWYLRILWLLPLGYVPLAALLFARLW
jgi:Zn-dependent membrane protease YugP